MKSRMTRRSFVKKASAGLAGISFLAASTKSLYAGAANKANMLAIHGGTPVRVKPFSENLAHHRWAGGEGASQGAQESQLVLPARQRGL